MQVQKLLAGMIPAEIVEDIVLDAAERSPCAGLRSDEMYLRYRSDILNGANGHRRSFVRSIEHLREAHVRRY